MENPSQVSPEAGSAARLLLWSVIFIVSYLWWSLGNVKRLRPKGNSLQCQSIQNKNDTWERAVTGEVEKLGFDVPLTLDGCLRRGLEASDDGPCLGWRPSLKAPYSWLKYSEVIERCTHFGAGLVHLGLQPGTEAFVGIFARTCKEWVISEYASYMYSLVVVPLYDSLGPDACQSALNRLRVELLVCGEEKNLQTILTGKAGVKHLKTVIFMETISEGVRRQAQELGMKIYQFDEVVDMGKKNPSILRPAHPDDVGILVFTSGTTGEPKAAMLTHKAICKSVEYLLNVYLPVRIDNKKVTFGYLPLAHVMERIQELGMFINGARVGFNSSGIANLLDDIQELKPDVLVMVPRVLNRIYGRLQDAVRHSPVKRFIFNTAVFFKSIEMHFGFYRTNSIWDTLVFGKVQKLLGGRVSVVATGSAPQDPKLTKVMKAALGCYIHEVYGQTETSGVITATMGGDPVAGHVGCPVGEMEIKLVDVPELGYFSREGKGEICARGPLVMSGYYGQPDKTAETIDQDGFVHTGDIGQWIAGGRLKIIDRKKHIFKLSHGEYVAPEKLEMEFLMCPFFTQIFVDGSGLYPFTVALVYPNYDALPEELKPASGSGDASSSIRNTKELEKFLLDELAKVGKERHLRSYEVPKKLYFLPEPFSIENGFLTPTQKTKREVVRVAYKKQMDDLYANVSLFSS